MHLSPLIDLFIMHFLIFSTKRYVSSVGILGKVQSTVTVPPPVIAEVTMTYMTNFKNLYYTHIDR